MFGLSEKGFFYFESEVPEIQVEMLNGVVKDAFAYQGQDIPQRWT